jgi:hypothetical protein
MCCREAWASLRKAVRARRRHPADSAICKASGRELARAVEKALQHGPLRLRIDEGAGGTAGGELLLREAEPEFLAALVDSMVRGAPAPRGHEG